MDAKQLASLLRVSERTARRRLAALRADGGVRMGRSTGGRPPMEAPVEVLAERLGLTPEDLTL